jgi:hypothetical protein
VKQYIPYSVLLLALMQAGCGGGGSSDDAPTSSATGASISGTVPGTRIAAYADNGAYYRTASVNNGSAQRPFHLDVPVGVGFHLVMITGEGTADEVVTPIGFRDSQGAVHTRLALADGNHPDLGHVALHTSRGDAAPYDLDHNGVLDNPMVLDDAGAHNPLSQCDADKDGIDDWNDPDHGGYRYDTHITDPQDHDHDGIPNVHDHDHHATADDSDGDGLPDTVDANRHNDPDHANNDLSADCNHDGYNDHDLDHDGFHDDDSNHDGYHDDDHDHDGHHDGEDTQGGDSCGVAQMMM